MAIAADTPEVQAVFYKWNNIDYTSVWQVCLYLRGEYIWEVVCHYEAVMYSGW